MATPPTAGLSDPMRHFQAVLLWRRMPLLRAQIRNNLTESGKRTEKPEEAV